MPTLENSRMPSLRDKQIADEKARLEEIEAKKKADAAKEKKLEDGKGRRTKSKE